MRPLGQPPYRTCAIPPCRHVFKKWRKGTGQARVARLRQVSIRKSGGSSDDDTLDRPEWIWSETHGVQRRSKAWISKLAHGALALPAPERQPSPTASKFRGNPATRSRAVAEPSTLAPVVGTQKRGSKAAASPRAPPVQPNGTKVPPPTKEQQAPNHPMATRTREASRAGSL
jgi:hypothetical protein